MPTASKRQRRAAKAVKEEEVEEEEVAHEKENVTNGGGRRGKRKPQASSEDDGDHEDASNDDAADEDHDEDHREEEEEEEEEEEAPSSPKRSKKKGSNKASAHSPLANRHTNPMGKPAEAGIIQEVYVENFMCHRKLSVKLCRNVNFIHGQNGSGKSAILAAVQVCLGAGARRTHRARNLKDLVRKEAGADCSGAKLRVTLLNRGADGYKHDVYGDTITVERCISLRSGGYNGYKLLDCNMKEKSRAKKDLDAMLDQLNIQVENPVAVLDQEEAKKFLTGKPEDKYEFFTKATELERLDRCYASIADNILEQESTQARARDNIGGAIDNTKKLKKEWEQFQEMDKLEVEVQEMRANYGWSVHSEFEVQLQEEMKKAQKFSKALEKRKAELVTAEQSVNVTDDEEIALKNKLDELTEEANQAAEAKTKLENDVKNSLAPIKKKEQEKSVIKRELTQAKKMHKGALRRLEMARKEILESQGNAAEEERARTRKIAQTEQDLAGAKEKVDPLKEEIAKHLREYQDVEPSVAQTKETREGTERQLHAVQQKVRAMQAESGEGRQALAVFGSKCTALHAAVQKAAKAKKFRGPVAGPVGMYVKVIPGKEKWAQMAETAVGFGALDRFIVTNNADLELMKRLRKDVGCGTRDCALYRIHPRSTEEKYNVPAPPQGVETVTSVWNVENAMAFNFLVDHCSIDTCALTDSKESSEKALFVRDGRGKGGIRGGKVRKVFFFPKGDHWEVDKAGNQIMIGNDRPMKQTVGVDRTAAIEAAKHEMKAMQQELVRNKGEEKAVKDASYKAKKLWNEAQKAHHKVASNIKKMESLLDELKAEAETSEEVPTIDTSEYENDIEEAEASVQNLKEREAKIVQEIESLQPGVEEQKRQLDETSARNKKILDDMDKVDAKLEDIVKGQARRQELVDKVRAKVEQVEGAVQQQEGTVKEIKEKLADALGVARKMQFDFNRDKRMFELKKENGGDLPPGEEVQLEPTDEDLDAIETFDPPKEPKFYKAKIQSKLNKIEQEKVRRNMSESDPAVARDKYYRAKKDLDSKMEQINTIDGNCKNLRKDLSSRKKRWRQFRGHIAEMTNLGFDEFLNKKGSAGEVVFDHDDGKLDLIVQKDSSDSHSQTKDVKALSGGERSFATLSLLLAIGESLETPFRVMDEFDVFLDPVARKIAMKQLVTVAQEMEHRQFIFITPQDVSNIPTSNRLRIHKMKPPVRSKTVGGAQQQTLNFDN
eukprot:CAMPEP_0183707658 /NCGR_PEP_ID=MMETSP0737-20130205/4176_1 /TAXON_ID=385413 /ORGANISM="Thalassiosira miniscula, Strain CCMP1093" /LENGTH=1232 /DNA_ID=CAMNT_0025935381 /DNA_START=12 /DNA_END=3710 /DNA_ORIENTATION=-